MLTMCHDCSWEIYHLALDGKCSTFFGFPGGKISTLAPFAGLNPSNSQIVRLMRRVSLSFDHVDEAVGGEGVGLLLGRQRMAV